MEEREEEPTIDPAVARRLLQVFESAQNEAAARRKTAQRHRRKLLLRQARHFRKLERVKVARKKENSAQS